MSSLAAAELPYCCPPAAAALQLHYVSQNTFLCITLITLCCPASIHTQGQPLTHPLSCPGSAVFQRAQHLHPPQVLLLWPLFMPASELNKLHRLYCQGETYCQGGSWHIITPKAGILRRKRRQGEPNFFCSPRQLEQLLSCPEELGTTGVLCHRGPWEVGLRAPKLYHHDATIDNSMVPCGSCPVVSIEEWQHQASRVHAMGEQHSAVKPRAILLLPFFLLLLLSVSQE